MQLLVERSESGLRERLKWALGLGRQETQQLRALLLAGASREHAAKGTGGGRGEAQGGTGT